MKTKRKANKALLFFRRVKMSYLTYQEYVDFGFNEMEEAEFDKLIKKASDVVDDITSYFYVHNDIDDDVLFRRGQFKKAIAAQIEYFHGMGGTSSYELNAPGTVTIGRTTVSQGGRNSSGQSESRNNIVSSEVYMHLRYTGLLYSGIGVRS